MAEDTIDHAATLAGLDDRPSETRELQIHGAHPDAEGFGALADYGSDAPRIEALQAEDGRLAEPLHPQYPVTPAQVVWAVRNEAARTVEDVLARRTRMLLIDARASVTMAGPVAQWMARELGRDSDWCERQVLDYAALAEGYVLTEAGLPALPRM
jgi:glycerol-3-phosphate dehydrogenase